MVSLQRRTAGRALAASTAAALLLTACSSSGSAPAGSGPASGTTTSVVTSGATTSGATTSGTTTSGTASSAAPSGTASTGTERDAAQVLNYRIAYRLVTQTRTAPKGTTVYPQVSVAGGSGPVRAALARIVEGRIAAERQRFLADANDVAAAADGVSDQEISVAEQTRWGWLYNVRFTDYRGITGTAHPVTNAFAVTVDLRTGTQVRAADVFTRLGPVDTVVRAALKQRGVEPEALGMVTVGNGTDADASTGVDTYPTPGGLWVGLSQCIATCALGVVEVTIPWRKLPMPRPGVLPPSPR